MAEYDQQYRAVTDLETAANDGLNVRSVRDLADGLNNWARWGGGRQKVISEACIPKWESADTTDTNENVITVFAPRLIPHGFTKFTFTLGHERSAGGAGDVVWKLYATSHIYLGDVVMDTTGLSVDYSSTSITCSSSTHALTVTQDLTIPEQTSISSGVFFVLTAENDSGFKSYLTSIDVTPIYI